MFRLQLEVISHSKEMIRTRCESVSG